MTGQPKLPGGRVTFSLVAYAKEQMPKEMEEAKSRVIKKKKRKRSSMLGIIETRTQPDPLVQVYSNY